ncbi:head-tail connector protein [Wohlfahrtiimonas chitiniclastica]|uniref:head-tail connector protein n=1 Tax=Wohlfahrtiimonas chitiniclastica TaxID=400946 RepID=UPI000B9897E6|nr:head-tail connector protein [Wohlfahrtiimonas chitiniclastica]OYQ76051.1 hypothetical protein B9T18_01470 [Wohlfahrtiimonas chitiniclastica]
MIDLSVAKQHLRIDHDSEDELIQMQIEAAIEYAAKYLNRSIIAHEHDRKMQRDIVINSSIKAAVLLVLGTLYENRENEIVGSITSPLKFGTKALLDPYRIKMGV